jgi:hypothetical protein
MVLGIKHVGTQLLVTTITKTPILSPNHPILPYRAMVSSNDPPRDYKGAFIRLQDFKLNNDPSYVDLYSITVIDLKDGTLDFFNNDKNNQITGENPRLLHPFAVVDKKGLQRLIAEKVFLEQK